LQDSEGTCNRHGPSYRPRSERDVEKLLGITDRSSAAIHALALACVEPEGRMTVALAAERLGVSRTYLAKVLQALARSGIVETSRGAAGGFVTAKSPARISCLDVITALEGGFPDRTCLFEKPVCRRKTCALMELCRKISDTARRTLASTSIASVAAGFK